MSSFNYQEWRSEYIENSKASPGQVDYYCLMLMRDVHSAKRQHPSVGAYLGSKGVTYKEGDSQFSAVQALWEALGEQKQVKETHSALSLPTDEDPAEEIEPLPEPPAYKAKKSGKKSK